jgi:SAM-dependent methyltransferase
MPEIERLNELDALRTHPDYSGEVLSADQVAAGDHRKYVGGGWDKLGKRQVDFLADQGLRPGHRLMDVGCGSFRAGRHFIDYLDPGNYYGVDANHSVMQAGYDVELTDQQRAKLPIENLRANDRFFVDFGVPFDFAIAHSVFTHVSLNHIRLCLYRLNSVMAPGGSFYATFFEEKPDVPLDASRITKDGKGFFTEKNVFWYYRADMRWAATWGDWRHEYIGDWGHPVGQRMVKFTKLTPDEIEVARAAKQARREGRRAATPERP